jgi:hypothetical protein
MRMRRIARPASRRCNPQVNRLLYRPAVLGRKFAGCLGGPARGHKGEQDRSEIDAKVMTNGEGTQGDEAIW